MRFDLVLRNAMLDTRCDVGIAGDRIAAIAPRLGRADSDIDCGGHRLIPGLHDHHIHLLATAARIASVDLDGLLTSDDVAAALRAQAATLASDAWVRAVGYDERAAGLPDAALLDAWLPDRPLRVQDRTGALWAFNSAGLAALGPPPWPEGLERDARGVPTGRLWRGDAWLRARIGGELPLLVPLGQRLAACGVTAVTDAGANNGPDEVAALTTPGLPQRLTVMGREDLPTHPGYAVGPVKLLYDERDLPGVDRVAARIRAARTEGRAVAAHCVSVSELALFLAALDASGGAQRGDRIEHGSLIPAAFLPEIARRRLTVVVNPGFVHRRGDRYLAEVDRRDLPDLQRLGSLLGAGIRVAAGSDAPYGPVDPWVAIRAAQDRRTASGAVLNIDERIDFGRALSMYRAQLDSDAAGLEIGALADLCLFDPERDNSALLTVIGGRVVHDILSYRAGDDTTALAGAVGAAS